MVPKHYLNEIRKKKKKQRGRRYVGQGIFKGKIQKKSTPGLYTKEYQVYFKLICSYHVHTRIRNGATITYPDQQGEILKTDSGGEEADQHRGGRREKTHPVPISTTVHPK